MQSKRTSSLFPLEVTGVTDFPLSSDPHPNITLTRESHIQLTFPEWPSCSCSCCFLPLFSLFSPLGVFSPFREAFAQCFFANGNACGNRRKAKMFLFALFTVVAASTEDALQLDATGPNETFGRKSGTGAQNLPERSWGDLGSPPKQFFRLRGNRYDAHVFVA